MALSGASPDLSRGKPDKCQGILWDVPTPAADKLFLRLRTERERQDLTVQWVADRVGVTKQSLSEWETGKSRPGPAAVRKWVKALGLPEAEADEWLDWRVEEEVAEVLGKLRGPRALPAEDIEAIRRSVRNSLRARR